MGWLETLHNLQGHGEACVAVTVAQVRGHAPRGAGSKMIVTRTEVHGSVGGGNLEQSAVERARCLLAQQAVQPELFTLTLNPEGGDWGVQCCGGEVTLLLEPFRHDRPTVAIFGAGHVGWALVKVLGTLPIQICLIDSRADQLEPKPSAETLESLLTLRHRPVPEAALEDLPEGTLLLIMTHDHAEDIAILDTALKRDDFSFIGLIGSSAKWAHFRRELAKQGHDEVALARVTTPIGLPGIPGKSPQAIAIATAAQLLGYLELPETQF